MKRRTVQSLALHTAILLGAAVAATPLVWMVSASLMPAGDANSFPPPFLPRRVTFEHYVTILTRLDLAWNFLNSAIVTVTGTLLSVVFNGLAGYAFAKLVFPGRERLFRGLTLALVIPAQVGMLPLFLLLREMGVVNTYAGVVVPYLASVFGIFMVRQYVVGVPDDLLHAARVDGAGEFQLFTRIVVPVIQPILVTLAAFTFLSAWNDFMWPLIVLSDARNYTLPVALANLVGEHVQDTELMMAGSVLTILPAMVVFLLFQRAYVRGILAGSVKG
ncbi:MAG TPA: carbohydrate ABC transporter permease [Candidatus Krumholzibacteria bacterium]|jgi:multiple sugar transport system permease protein|nr:carbohydrate ABC transporter permease [Candidatus Krumholzibacteria bacterium]